VISQSRSRVNSATPHGRHPPTANALTTAVLISPRLPPTHNAGLAILANAISPILSPRNPHS
jgi:hypothetical protein